MDDIIARRKLTSGTTKRKREVELEDLESTGEEDEGDDSGSEDSEIEGLDDDESDDPLASSGEEEGAEELGEELAGKGLSDEDGASTSDDDSDHETQTQKDRKAAFFAPDSETAAHTSFLTMNLSRPILKAITSLSFHQPTPIQAATIPVALLGKDVVGNAVTGSGKTAAFIIPVLERLLYRERGKKASAIRCVVLVPTRELAVQCYDVGKRLAAHTDIRFSLIVGACIYSFVAPTIAYILCLRWAFFEVSGSRAANASRCDYSHPRSAYRPFEKLSEFCARHARHPYSR